MALIKWSGPARRDFSRIDAHYFEIDPAIANRMGGDVIRAAQFLLDNPMAGPVVEQTRMRKWIVRKTPYILLYRPDAGGIRIVRIRHMAEDRKPKP
jgi:toxin ParE1/3/4